jgi:hypothetical protein
LNFENRRSELSDLRTRQRDLLVKLGVAKDELEAAMAEAVPPPAGDPAGAAAPAGGGDAGGGQGGLDNPLN